MNEDEVLQALQDSKALLNGHFELRSGLHSDQFFQCALVLRYPRLAERLCSALVDKVKDRLGDKANVDAVMSPALGGILVGQDVARALDVRSTFAEKKDGELVVRRGFKITPGERFIIAEDVVTTGSAVKETVKIVTDAGGIVEAVAVLVDRSGGKASFDCPLVSLLEMSPVTYDPGDCPLCAGGSKAVHPGS